VLPDNRAPDKGTHGRSDSITKGMKMKPEMIEINKWKDKKNKL